MPPSKSNVEIEFEDSNRREALQPLRLHEVSELCIEHDVGFVDVGRGGTCFAFDGFGCRSDRVWREVAENSVTGASATASPASSFDKRYLKMSLISLDDSVTFWMTSSRSWPSLKM